MKQEIKKSIKDINLKLNNNNKLEESDFEILFLLSLLEEHNENKEN